MREKKTNKPSLVLIESESQSPKIKTEGDDELALLIRSINEKARASNSTLSQSQTPEPPKAA